MSLPSENEIVEFKEAKNDFDLRKLGKYFSALSNEANLKGKHDAWLIFGIENRHKRIVCSNYRKDSRPHLDSLKGEIAQKTTNRISFIEIYELTSVEGRVILFQIPAAPRGFPVAWEGHYCGRDGEKLCPLNKKASLSGRLECRHLPNCFIERYRSNCSQMRTGLL